MRPVAPDSLQSLVAAAAVAVIPIPQRVLAGVVLVILLHRKEAGDRVDAGDNATIGELGPDRSK